MGFIDDWVNCVSKLTDSPPLFIRATGYWLTSFLFGRYVYCPYTRRGLKRPNVWFLLAGPSGITRKSTIVHSYGKNYAKRLYKSFLETSRGKTPQEAEEIAKYMFVEKATPEGLADHLNYTSSITDRYSLLSSEFGGIVNLSATRDYMASYFQDLSNLYYGEGGVWYLSGRKAKKKEDRIREIPDNLYFTAMVGLQELHLYVDPMLIEQGFLRRFIIVCQEGGDKEKRLPPIDTRMKKLEKEFDTLVNDYTGMMENYHIYVQAKDSYLPIFIRINQRIVNKITEFWRQVEDEYIGQPSDLYLKYKQNLWEHLTKLCILEAISRTPKPEYKNQQYSIRVLEEDFDKASDFLMKVLPKTQESLSKVGSQPMQQQLPISSGKINFIFSLVETAGDKGITKADLLNKSGLVKDELKKLVITLIEQERVVAFKASNNVVFFTKDKEIVAVSNYGTPLSSAILDAVW